MPYPLSIFEYLRAPLATALLGTGAFILLLYILSHPKVQRFFKSRGPHWVRVLYDRLESTFGYLLIAIIIVDLPIAAFAVVDYIISIDRVRHYFSDKKHPISKEQVLDTLGFDLNLISYDLEESIELIRSSSTRFNDDSQHYIDSLTSAFTGNPTYSTGVELHQIIAENDFPVEASEFLLKPIIHLARTKYQVLHPLLWHYYLVNDYDGVMNVYELAKGWKWDRDIGGGSPKDHRDQERNDIIAASMHIAIMLLEENNKPMTDSIARIILEDSKIGLKAYHQFQFFRDKRSKGR